MFRTPDPTKCRMSGPGLKTGEVLVPQAFTIQAKNAKNNNIEAGTSGTSRSRTPRRSRLGSRSGSRTTTTARTLARMTRFRELTTSRLRS